jgi:hypothetical protein
LLPASAALNRLAREFFKMLTLLAVTLLAVGAAWGGFRLWTHLEVLKLEVDLVLDELHKLRLEATNGKLPHSVRQPT